MNTSTLVQKIWSFCHTLRDDGVGYGDYLEQLTYLLFLKLAHECAEQPYQRQTRIPPSYDWASLDDLPSPEVLQQEIIDHLEAALVSFRGVAAALPRMSR